MRPILASFSTFHRRGLIPALAFASIALAACGDESSTPARTYAMGFSGFPPRPDLGSILATIEMWAPRADVALVLTEVPWDSLLAGRQPDALIRNNQLGLAQYYRAKGLRVIASVDPTNGLNRASDSAPLVAAGRSLTEPSIQALYRGYVTAMDTLLHPDYLAIASETNLIRAIAPASLYDAVVLAANGAAADVRAVDPQARLFTTVQVEVAWGRIGTGGYEGISRDRTDFPFIDALGLSSYPYLAGFADPDSVPLDYYDRLDDGAPLPMLVIEGGWSSVTVSPVATTPEMQRRYIERHASILDRAGAIAWFQITFTDLDVEAFGLPPGTDLTPFAYLGLVDENLDPKPALAAWDAIFARPFNPGIPPW